MQHSPAGRDFGLQRSPDKKTIANLWGFTIIPACLCVMCATQRNTQYDIRNTKIGRSFNGTSNRT